MSNALAPARSIPLALLVLTVLMPANRAGEISYNVTENDATNHSSTLMAKPLTPALTTPGPLVVHTYNTTVNTTVDNTNLTLSIPQKPPPVVGMECETGSDCKGNNTACMNKICACEAGYINSKEMLRCLKVATKLNEDCSEDEQCTAGLSEDIGPTVCLNFLCSCAIGMKLEDGKCKGPRELLSNCTEDEHCPVRKSACIDNRCACRDGFVPNSQNNLCLLADIRLEKLAAPLTECSEDVQCASRMGDDAICEISDSGGACTCKPGTHMVTKLSKCIQYKDLGATCSYSEECITKDNITESIDSRICNQGICKCNVGWTQVDNVCTGGASSNALTAALLAFLLLFWTIDSR